MLDVFSFGGGVQSTAVLALAAQGRIDCRSFIFANVGADSENPGTIEYVEKVSRPYAAAHGIDLLTVGREESLLQHALRSPSTIAIPVRMKNGAPGNRTCTDRWKIQPIAKWLRGAGFTKDRPALMGLGISTDEAMRVRTDSGIAHVKIAYPLIDLKLSRKDCGVVIREAGLPIPPRSSCWFCPYHTVGVWDAMRRDEPEKFARAVALERQLSEKRAALGKDAIYLSSRAKPLDEAFPGDEPGLFDNANCESGHCFT